MVLYALNIPIISKIYKYKPFLQQLGLKKFVNDCLNVFATHTIINFSTQIMINLNIINTTLH